MVFSIVVRLIVWYYLEVFPYLMAVVAVVIIGVIVLMRRSYTQLSSENLHDSSRHISRKLHAIEVLGQQGHVDGVLILAKDLMRESTHPIIREKIIGTISHLRDPRIIHAYIHILENPCESNEITLTVLASLL